MAEKKVIVTQVRSHIRGPKKHLDTLKCLGLGKVGRSVEHRYDQALEGMVRSVAHLVEVKRA